MDKYKIKKTALGLVSSLLLAGILGVLADVAIAWQGIDVPCALFLLAIAGLTAVLYLLNRKKPKRPLAAAEWLLGGLLLLAAALFACWWTFSNDAALENIDLGKEDLYGGHRVMAIVPHQDDELNLLEGALEEYVRYGSELYLVFVTNGDCYGLTEERFREALAVSDEIGIPQENVIFLGYGDTWKDGGPHIYNGGSEQILESANGRKETYGAEFRDPWRTGVAYTVDNYLDDLQSVIVSYRPDVIFCNDYDWHIDHRAVSMAFEKVMGQILQTDPDYRPQVYKGYAYASAWYAEPDFFATNILSTRNVFEEPYNQKPAIYRWEERIRLPVAGNSLSRSLFASGSYRLLELYDSQEASFQAARIINGDKVFWYRPTSSLCYRADVTVSSGDGTVLKDFMLLDNYDLANQSHMPYDGVWVPVDQEKKVEFNFQRSIHVRQIRLYDNPSPTDNVLAGKVLFSDGTEMEFGPLDPSGAVMMLDIGEKNITGFTVVLTQTQGEYAGLAEVEAYEEQPEPEVKYVKLTDPEGNFIYDYWIPEGSEAYLDAYTLGISEGSARKLRLSWDSKDCWAEYVDGKIWVIVPEGKTMTLKASVEGSYISDTVRIHNPGMLIRLRCQISQFLEQQLFQKYCDGVYRNSATYKMMVTVLDLIQNK